MRTVAFMVAISVGLGGCAVAAAKGPPDGPISLDHRPDCNTGKGGVVADGLGATVLGLTTLGLVAAEEGGAAVTTGILSVALIASAVSGSRTADRCRAAQAEYEAALESQRLDTVAEAREARAELAALRRGEPPPSGTIPPTGVRPIAPPTPTPPTPARPTPTPPTAPARPPVASPTPIATPVTDADDGAAAGDDGDWSEFWREVTP